MARELAPDYGVLEPLQTKTSLEGQVAELAETLGKHAALPATLVGHSWGAWLSFIVASRQPKLVKKLILVSSAPFGDKYVAQIDEARLARLSADERAELVSLAAQWQNGGLSDAKRAFARLGALVSKADSYDPIPDETNIDYRPDIFEAVWQEAARMRRDGSLLSLAKNIRCPVVAIHGDYDSHLASGVCEPLSAALSDFRFVLLEKCGHTPWLERQARDRFYEALRRELGPSPSL